MIGVYSSTSTIEKNDDGTLNEDDLLCAMDGINNDN